MSASRQINALSLHHWPVKCPSLQSLITATALFEDNVSTSEGFGLQGKNLNVPYTYVMFFT